ncbi:MAG: hypothetical protein WBG92_10310 [Thiohalocapsa sp.]
MNHLNQYRPISCDHYDLFEIAIMRGQRRRLVQRGDSGQETELFAWPIDVCAADGAEWLTIEDDDGKRRRLRLDLIRFAAPEQRTTR